MKILNYLDNSIVAAWAGFAAVGALWFVALMFMGKMDKLSELWFRRFDTFRDNTSKDMKDNYVSRPVFDAMIDGIKEQMNMGFSGLESKINLLFRNNDNRS